MSEDQKTPGEVLLGAMRDQLRKAIEADPVLFPEFEAFFLSLESESDRALVIVAFSYIDEKFHQLMARALRKQFTKGDDDLFASFAPLSTASARIKMCGGLHWISDNVYHDLNLVRKLRNYFAHNPLSQGLEAGKAISWFNELRVTEEPVWKVVCEKTGSSKEVSIRVRIHVRLILLTARLLVELSGAPMATRMGLQPGAAEVDGWDSLPLHFRELYELSMQVVVKVVGSAQCAPLNAAS